MRSIPKFLVWSLPAIALPVTATLAQRAPAGSAQDERAANSAASSLSLFIDPVKASPATSAPKVDARIVRRPDGSRCTTNLLVHAEVGPAITARVTAAVRLREPGAGIRDVARLVLPCGFSLERQAFGNLVLGNGREFRRYHENNPFGFAPAFGFGGQITKPYELKGEVVSGGSIREDACGPIAQSAVPPINPCAGFGSAESFFGATATGKLTSIAHYVTRDGKLETEFTVADTGLKIIGLSFLPPPDAPGGTLTLLLEDRGSTYRAYIDTPRG